MFSPFFSHIYIEDAAKNYELAQICLAQFPKAELVDIKNYKEIFNRPRQEWQLQAKTRKLILAVKPDDFLYCNSELVASFGQQYSYYNSHVLNCLYNCSYCYLQGLYPSANVVVFVNTGDFTLAAEKALEQHKRIYLCISYDTDLLAFEKILGLNRTWIQFASKHKNIIIESRTKSGNFNLLADLEPVDNFILAWTLSPESIQKSKELQTASITKRIAAAKAACERGWKVRVCFDPILLVDNWQEHYQALINNLAEHIDLSQIHDFSLGSFRINADFLKNITKQNRFDPVIYYPYHVTNNIAGYENHVASELNSFVISCLIQHGVDNTRCVTI